VVVTEEWRGELSVDNAGAGGSWWFLLDPSGCAMAVPL